MFPPRMYELFLDIYFFMCLFEKFSVFVSCIRSHGVKKVKDLFLIPFEKKTLAHKAPKTEKKAFILGMPKTQVSVFPRARWGPMAVSACVRGEKNVGESEKM